MDRVTEFLRSYLVPAGTGLAGDPGLKASRWSTGGALSVFEASIAGGPPLHVHDREDECFYVLGGELSVRCGEEAFSAGAGSFVFLPRGRPVLARPRHASHTHTRTSRAPITRTFDHAR